MGIKSVTNQKLFQEADVKDIMVPRLNEEEQIVPGGMDSYLHWMSLVMLARDAFPDASIESEVIEDTAEAITIKVSLYKFQEDTKPVSVAHYKQRYTDDAHETFTSCQSMALRIALIWAGIGTNIVLEDEILRRKDKIAKADSELETLKEENKPISSEELYAELTEKMEKKKASKKQSSKKDEEAKSDQEIEDDIFAKEGIQTPAKENAEENAEAESAPETTEEPAESDVCEDASENITSESSADDEGDNPAGGSPSDEPDDSDGAKDKQHEEDAGESIPDNEYIIKSGDFCTPNYDRKYTGKTLSDLGEDALRVIVNNSDVVTAEFKKVIEEYLND